MPSATRSQGTSSFRSVAVTATSLLLVVVLTSLSATAQEKSAVQPIPRLEVFGGYSYLRFDSKVIGFAEKSDLHGGNVSVSYRLYKGLGVAADVSAHSGTDVHLYNFLIGPQLWFPRGKMNFVGHVFYGKTRNQVSILGGETSIGRALAIGGGVDRNLTPRVAVRLIQVDYLNTHTFGSDENSLRLSAGLVFQFGKK